MTVRADICKDTIDTDYYGWIQGFAYIAGADREGYLTDISIPLLPEDENPRTVPYIHFLGEEGWPIEDFLAVYDQISALLIPNSIDYFLFGLRQSGTRLFLLCDISRDRAKCHTTFPRSLRYNSASL